MKLVDYINSDLKARGAKPGLVSFCRNYFSLLGGGVFRYTCWLRVCHFVLKNKFLHYSVGWMCLLIRSHYEVKYGIVTPSSIEIGRGLNIVHGGGVFLNCESIGDNFTVFQGVTLGKKAGNTNEGFPIVGDNVMVCTGAVVVGHVKLGNGCVVGANSFVSHDVPPKTLVAGVPAKIIKELD